MSSSGAPSAHHRVASYNLHRCVGSDGKRDVNRIATLITELDADIIGVQEIDCGYFGHELDQLDQLQRATGMNGIFGATLRREACTYGNALFTRWPVTAVRHVDLSHGRRREPRAALDVDLEINGTTARVIVTHFGLRPWERRAQTAALLAALRHHTRPLTILCGDFNEWTPMWPTVRELDTHFGASPSLRTFPARRPLFALDRIWVRPTDALMEVWVHRSALARVASDHLPICASVVT